MNNRIYKFRAWDKRTEKMLYSVGITSVGEPFINHRTDLGDDAILMQFTGLKDKNGKEIYEGDIVKTNALIHFNCEVNFHQGIFGLVDGNGRHHPLREFVKTGTSENVISIDAKVIGNIYSNPELLK